MSAIWPQTRVSVEGEHLLGSLSRGAYKTHAAVGAMYMICLLWHIRTVEAGILVRSLYVVSASGHTCIQQGKAMIGTIFHVFHLRSCMEAGLGIKDVLLDSVPKSDPLVKAAEA